MSKLSNPALVRFLVMVVCLFGWGVKTSTGQPPTADTPPSWLLDAELTDVFFLNEELGWAVGEHGTILKTTDGGTTWKNTANLQTVTDRDTRFQGEMGRVLNTLENNLGRHSAPNTRMVSTGINFRFESVHFCDAKNGIVVGGYDLPYLDRSRAVVMRTFDGGNRWKVVGGLMIPRLSRVRMNNEASIWAVGDSSNLNRVGIYSSSDGGGSWSSQSSELEGAFLDADRTAQATVAIDAEGRLQVLRGNQAEFSVVLGESQNSPLRRVKMMDSKVGWAVGHSGQVLRTENGGVSWRAISAIELQSESKIDFQALTLANDKVWIAGNPGTYILSVDLKSGAISRHRTPSMTAINAISFSGSTHGWAVGDGGNILATTDGGATWQAQRTSYPRVALMGVAFGKDSLPLATLAQYAGENDLATASICVALQGDEYRDYEHRIQQATSRLGCNICRFIYPDSRQSMEDSIRKLTMAIRTLRPNVIVCESPIIRDSSGVFSPQNVLEKAIAAAADRQQFSDQLIELGLSTWQVDRLAVLDSAGLGELKVNTDRFLPTLGQTIEDYSAISSALVDLPVAESVEKSLSVQQFSIARGFRGSDILNGLRQLGRKIPSRSNGNVRRGNLQLMQQNVGRVAQIKELGNWRDASPNSLLVWRQRLNSIIVGQDDDLAGVWLSKLANSYMRAGQWQLAAVTLNQLVARYEDHPLAPAAMMWLAQYHVSDEMLAARIRKDQVKELPDSIEDELLDMQIEQANYQASAQTFQSDGMTHMVWVPDQVKKEVDEELAASGLVAPKVDPVTESYQLASAVIARLRNRDPDLARDRQLKFLEAKMTSRLQSTLAAENLFQQLVRNSQEGDSLFVASGREIKLVKNQPETYQGTFSVPLDSRPKLDGDLRDDCWSRIMNHGKANFLRMTPPGENTATKTDVVIFAHDEEFFYVAARCNKLDDYPYRTNGGPRSRDAELVNRDRIEFALDTDRDYRTFLQFSVDHRGWCHDAAHGSASWDPEWFIAQSEDDKSWSVEIAIPLAQLTSSPMDAKTVWAISASRKMGRYAANLWPTRSLNFQTLGTGLHRISELDAKNFELIRFGTETQK